jgi:hypothetical protein
MGVDIPDLPGWRKGKPPYQGCWFVKSKDGSVDIAYLQGDLWIHSYARNWLDRSVDITYLQDAPAISEDDPVVYLLKTGRLGLISEIIAFAPIQWPDGEPPE